MEVVLVYYACRVMIATEKLQLGSWFLCGDLWYDIYLLCFISVLSLAH